MTSCARLLSEELRDPNGPHKVDLIIAITHCRLPNDIDLANETGAVVPAPQEHGVDLILGGHDHLFYTGPVATFEGEPFETPIGSEKDEKCAIVKSGTDFRDLSEIELEISEPGEGVRRRTITAIKGECREASASRIGSHTLLLSQSSGTQPSQMIRRFLSCKSRLTKFWPK